MTHYLSQKLAAILLVGFLFSGGLIAQTVTEMAAPAAQASVSTVVQSESVGMAGPITGGFPATGGVE